MLGGSNLFLSSQTDKSMAGAKFSDYLGLNHYKKAKKIKHFIHLRLAQRPQSLSTYHTLNSGHRDVMQCQISIFELKIMIKIGVIFMPFSNPTCHFRDTADFTLLKL